MFEEKQPAVDCSIEDILAEMAAYLPEERREEQLIRDAFLFAEEAHGQHGLDREGRPLGEPQRRRSGKLYITHPLETARILAQFRLDPPAIAAGLLHDVIEDTARTAEEVESRFGAEIANLCRGLAKLSKVRYQGEDWQIDNLRRMFVAIAEDLRVIFVKLADRLHNMRTLEFVPPEKRRRIAKETLEVFVPIADRLGLFEIKTELENLCFRHLYPLAFLSLSREIEKRRERDELFLNRVCEQLENLLGEEEIEGRVAGRVKHLFSLFKKMKEKGKQLDEIYDRLACRIILKRKKDCYAVLGALHSRWQVKLGRFKDFIAIPKVNGYQSLHTVIFPFLGEDRQPVEIQIRTEAMHREAEFGMAAHWLYAEEGKESTVADESQRRWVSALRELKKETADSAADFAEALKTDLLEDRIFVFTPAGKVVDLPRGATPVDFAFAVHSEVGEKCHSAIVDGKVLPLSSSLTNGQVVEIRTRNSAEPSRDWLSFVKTSAARSKIRAFLREKDRDQNLLAGEEFLSRELARHGFPFPRKGKEAEERRTRAVEKTPFKTFEDLLVGIGTGGWSAATAVHRMFAEEFEARAILEKEELEKKRAAETPSPSRKLQIEIEGGSAGIEIGFRSCCKDLKFGESVPLVGYLTRGKGIAIHRADCPMIKNADPARLVAASLAGEKKDLPISIRVETDGRRGLFRRALEIFAKEGIELTEASLLNGRSGGERSFKFSFRIESFARLQRIFLSLEKVAGVKEVRRN